MPGKDPLIAYKAAARELVAFAGRLGIDLSSLCEGFMFARGSRWIDLWFEDDVVRYSLQGRVAVLPSEFEASADLFTGWWNEAGSLRDIEQAFRFLKAWLLDEREVEDLPLRCMRSRGIG
jgi:hypothetical protein